MVELSGKVWKVFVGHADNIFDDQNYKVLMNNIQAEQKLSALQPEISQQHNIEISVEQFGISRWWKATSG